MSTAACMGGWACPKRATCAHHAKDDRSVPVERLCEPGATDAYVPAIPALREAA